LFPRRISSLGGAESDEGVEVFGRAEGVHSEARSRRRAGGRHLTYFNWKKKYEGMQPPEMRRLKQLEDENAKLKKIVADLSLDRDTAAHARADSRSAGASRKST
jgi:hypothetical protein